MKTYLITVLMFTIYAVTPVFSVTDNPCDYNYNKEWENKFKCQKAYSRSPERRNSYNLSTTEQAIAEERFILNCIKDLTEYQEQYCKENAQSFLQDDDTDSDEISILELLSTLAIAAENEEKCKEAYIGSSDQQQASKLTTTERAIAKEKFILDCVQSLTEFQFEYVEGQ